MHRVLGFVRLPTRRKQERRRNYHVEILLLFDLVFKEFSWTSHLSPFAFPPSTILNEIECKMFSLFFLREPKESLPPFTTPPSVVAEYSAVSESCSVGGLSREYFEKRGKPGGVHVQCRKKEDKRKGFFSEGRRKETSFSAVDKLSPGLFRVEPVGCRGGSLKVPHGWPACSSHQLLPSGSWSETSH